MKQTTYYSGDIYFTDEKVELDSQTVTNIYDECEEEKNVIATCECKDEKTSLSYESLEYRIKETITLQTKPESNIFSFELTLQDMYAKNIFNIW